MGGSVTVVLRQKDGTVVPMRRRTNPLSFWIAHPDFIADRDDHFLGYINNSGRAGQAVPLAPYDYGMVVLDRQTKHLLSYQGYTAIRSFPASYLTHLMRPMPSIDGFRPTVSIWVDEKQKDEEIDRFERLLEEERLYVVDTKHPAWREKETWMRLAGRTVDEVVAEIDQIERLRAMDDKGILQLCIDVSPWSYERFSDCDDLAGGALKEKLGELGFVFSDADETAWQEWFSETT